MTNNYRRHQEVELQLLLQSEASLKPQHITLETLMLRKQHEAETAKRVFKKKQIEADHAKEAFRQIHSKMSNIRRRRGEIESEFFRFPEDQDDWNEHQ